MRQIPIPRGTITDGRGMLSREWAHFFEALASELAAVKSLNGYGNPTGNRSRATFDTATVTTEQLAERVAAMIDDLGGY